MSERTQERAPTSVAAIFDRFLGGGAIGSARIIQMLDRINSHLGLEQHRDADSREMNQHIAVEHLVDELDRRMTDPKA
jgi:hypothetical protein